MSEIYVIGFSAITITLIFVLVNVGMEMWDLRDRVEHLEVGLSMTDNFTLALDDRVEDLEKKDKFVISLQDETEALFADAKKQSVKKTVSKKKVSKKKSTV